MREDRSPWGTAGTVTVTCPLLCWEQSQGVESQRKPGKVTSPHSILPSPSFFFFLKLTKTQTDWWRFLEG